MLIRIKIRDNTEKFLTECLSQTHLCVNFADAKSNLIQIFKKRNYGNFKLHNKGD